MGPAADLVDSSDGLCSGSDIEFQWRPGLPANPLAPAHRRLGLPCRFSNRVDASLWEGNAVGQVEASGAGPLPHDSEVVSADDLCLARQPVMDIQRPDASVDFHAPLYFKRIARPAHGAGSDTGNGYPARRLQRSASQDNQ